MKTYSYILLLILALAACKKKELPPATNGNPIFKFIGIIGKDSIDYQAGINNMYLYSNYYKDDQNLLTLQSYFGKDNCNNCEPYLSFELKDFEVSTSSGLAGTIQELLNGSSSGTFKSYSLDSIVSLTTIETFTFIPSFFNSPTSTYLWNFGDGTTSNLYSPSHKYTGGGTRTVSLNLQSGGSVDSLSNTIDTDIGSGCRAQFSVDYDSLTNRTLVTATPSAFSFAWNFGDGNFGTGSVDSNFYSTPGKYTIIMTATSPTCSSIYKQKVSNTFIPQSLANFNYNVIDSSIVSLVPRINKSAFIVTYKKDGNTYKSFKNNRDINQSNNLIFTVTSVSPYTKNELGQNTIKVSGTINTYLYNQNNSADSIKITSNNIVLAAAYPN